MALCKASALCIETNEFFGSYGVALLDFGAVLIAIVEMGWKEGLDGHRSPKIEVRIDRLFSMDLVNIIMGLKF